MRDAADTNRIWSAIIAMAVVVFVLFFFNPFGDTAHANDPILLDDDTPFIAYFPMAEKPAGSPTAGSPASEAPDLLGEHSARVGSSDTTSGDTAGP